MLHSGEQKILVNTDQFVVSLNEIARVARSLEPTKQNTGLVGRLYDPLGILASKCSFRQCAKPSLNGISRSLLICCQGGRS